MTAHVEVHPPHVLELRRQAIHSTMAKMRKDVWMEMTAHVVRPLMSQTQYVGASPILQQAVRGCVDQEMSGPDVNNSLRLSTSGCRSLLWLNSERKDVWIGDDGTVIRPPNVHSDSVRQAADLWQEGVWTGDDTAHVATSS
ncbi:hypothetical protein AVEN_243348-1 [Araneus ventricosus]|uniref:Uncharacterized protein n=1 Tax=Araneus ventricosus TaxID=182803 RepID=A0A4Y2HBE6_ARAVE|nr:hypothetical protein AVEN_243348-1 [Araneus ventricosus]